MDVPSAPPKTNLPQVPRVQPPLNSEYGANPPPVVVQQQETRHTFPNNPQPNVPPYQQPGYPQPGQQPNPAPVPYPFPSLILQPITEQPGAGEWMPLLQEYLKPNCPPGLEYLTAINRLLVHQEIDIMEIITGYENPNKYTVKNMMGQKIFDASEISDFCPRQCYGSLRPFDMQIVGNHGQEVLHFNRPYACTGCCCPCCLQTMEVSAPLGTVIGSVKQEWSLFKPKFSIQDASGETVLIIRAPCCIACCCKDILFNVYSKDGETKVGRIRKQWGGFAREAVTDANNFEIDFPVDLDVKIKATLLGACILIDFVFFEEPPRRRRR